MKPSNLCEVVTVLNTPAELSVVFEAIKEEPRIDATESDQPDIGSRFRDQTRHQQPIDVCPCFPVPYIPREQWKPRAEFAVTYDDEDFVLGAAKRVINERGLYRKTKNMLTRRLKAAETIATFFETPRQWRTWQS